VGTKFVKRRSKKKGLLVLSNGGVGIREFVEGLVHSRPDDAKKMRGDMSGGVGGCKGVIVDEESVVVKVSRVVSIWQVFGSVPGVKVCCENVRNVLPVGVDMKGSWVRERVERERWWGPV
jgi:hypothetical protein